MSEELKGEIQWSEKQVISLLLDVLGTLQFVHENNVIHRDINPNNLIRREKDKRLILIDFGAVKQIQQLRVDSHGQTRSLIVFGTKGFIPNEQQGGNARFSSDIYALGMTAIQALTGVLAHLLKKDERTDEVVWRHEAPQVSNELAEIIDKMVKSHWRDRYQSVSEVLQDLNNLHTPVSSTTYPQTPNPTPIPQIYSIAAYEPIEFKLDFHPNWLMRGVGIACRQRNEEALAAFEQAIIFKPDDHQAWNWKGRMQEKLQRYEEALAAYEQAIIFKPDYHKAWYNRGNALRKLQRYEEALAAYKQAIKLKPDYHDAWRDQGIALEELQRYEEALVAYEQAIQIKSRIELFFGEAIRYRDEAIRYRDNLKKKLGQ